MLIHNDNNAIDKHYSNINQSPSDTMKVNNFANVMSTVETKASAEADENKATAMDTNQGHQKINLDDYFAPRSTSHAHLNIIDIPLLLPTAHNVDTLSKYSEGKFKDLLSEYNIPSPPTSIEFDAEGKLVLPKDYPYASELKQAFEEQPDVAVSYTHLTLPTKA